MYSLTAYAPWEDFRAAFNGNGGLLETEMVENSHVDSGGNQSLEDSLETSLITLWRLFEKPVDVAISQSVGAYRGRDEVLVADVFREQRVGINQYMSAALHIEAVLSILTGTWSLEGM